MDPQHTQAFIAGVEAMFSDMLGMPVTAGEPRAKTQEDAWLDISGAIALSGSIAGTMAITLDRDTAQAVVSEMLGAAMDFESEDTTDAVGEIANIVAGKAKAKLNTDGTLSISCPKVTRGTTPENTEAISTVTVIDFDCPDGPFRLEWDLKNTNAVSDVPHAA